MFTNCPLSLNSLHLDESAEHLIAVSRNLLLVTLGEIPTLPFHASLCMTGELGGGRIQLYRNKAVLVSPAFKITGVVFTISIIKMFFFLTSGI